MAGSKSLVRCGEQTSGRLRPSSFGTIACEITSPQDSRVPEKPIPCFSYLYWAVDPITPWTRYAVARSVRYIEHSLQPYRQVLIIFLLPRAASCIMMEARRESTSCDHLGDLHVGVHQAELCISYSLTPILIRNFHSCLKRYSYPACFSQSPSSLRS